LIRLFPARQVVFDAAFAGDLRDVPEGPSRRTGIEWGEFVADAICSCAVRTDQPSMLPTRREAVLDVGSDGAGVCARAASKLAFRHAIRDGVHHNSVHRLRPRSTASNGRQISI